MPGDIPLSRRRVEAKPVANDPAGIAQALELVPADLSSPTCAKSTSSVAAASITAEMEAPANTMTASSITCEERIVSSSSPEQESLSTVPREVSCDAHPELHHPRSAWLAGCLTQPQRDFLLLAQAADSSLPGGRQELLTQDMRDRAVVAERCKTFVELDRCDPNACLLWLRRACQSGNGPKHPHPTNQPMRSRT